MSDSDKVDAERDVALAPPSTAGHLVVQGVQASLGLALMGSVIGVSMLGLGLAVPARLIANRRSKEWRPGAGHARRWLGRGSR